MKRVYASRAGVNNLHKRVDEIIKFIEERDKTFEVEKIDVFPEKPSSLVFVIHGNTEMGIIER